ncbi:MAG: CPBP family intramembrane glutamic endopeptidase [Candidatus Bipolaricaulia bacterium]
MSETTAGVFAGVLFLAASALVFVFGSSYYALFRTNKSWLFKATLVGMFVPAAWFLLRSDLDPTYGFLAFAFLAAAAANVLGAAAARLHRPLGLRDDSVKGMALGKGVEAIVVVGTVLLLLVVLRVPFGSVYLQTGHLGLGLAIGAGGFLLFAIAAAFQARSMKITSGTIRRLLPWILLFVFANAFMEELWFRALFLRPLTSLLGPVLAVLLTAIVFTVVHVGATYLSKAERVRFLVILFPLGLAWGTCMHFTDSIIASMLFHAGADLMIINGFIAALHKPEAVSVAPSAAP